MNWKYIPEFGGRYKISETGIVKSLPRLGKKERILKSYSNRAGYLYVCLSKNGIRFIYGINRLIALAFLGQPPSPNHQAAHRNGVRKDNTQTNIYWATPAENHRDKIKHGTMAKGITNGRAKLDDDSIRFIRSSSEPCAKLGEIFGVDESVIWRARHKFTWKHII